MATNLPPEVWIKIVSYLSDTDLAVVCPVNRLFYEISSAVRYEYVCVPRLLSNRTLERIEVLSSTPSLAHHTRTFKVDLCAFATPSRPHHPTSISLEPTALFLRRTVNLLKRKDPHEQTTKPTHEIFDTLAVLTAHMTHVQHCLINMYTCRDKQDNSSYPHDQILLLRRLWPILSDRIKSLSLSSLIPWQMMTLYDIFSGSTLTHLSLHLSFDYPNSWGSSGLTDIAHFIYGFKDTLQSLQLTAFHGLSIPHWREAFDDLGYFPYLQHIELQLKIDEFVGPSVFSFLERHQAHITELSLGQLYPGVPHLNSLSLPNLRKLCLDTECSAGGLHDFWTSPIDFKLLTNLALTAPSLPSNSLSDFCKECRDSGFGDQLRYLALDMRLLNGGVFDSLSITFPLLYSLSVSYRILSNADGSGIWTSIGFVQQMEPRLYPKWRLYDMSIIQIQEDFFQPDMIMYTLMEAIARSIPTVKSFCGSGHMDFMESRVPVHPSDELH